MTGGQSSPTVLDEDPAFGDSFSDAEVDDVDGLESEGSDGAFREAGFDRDEPVRRRFGPNSVLRGRAVFAAVTLGALTAAAAGQSLLPHSPRLTVSAASQPHDVAVVVNTTGDAAHTLEVQPAARVVDASAEVAQLTESARLTSEVSTAAYVKPADGSVTSTFGGSYGTMHYGIEISGNKDAPILAAANGTIIAAGPTSGFGMWVKEQLSDGTVLVYARMDDFSVSVGQQVTAGQQIARMGDRGFSTGYTLHFEVWNTAGKKIDPEQWLNERGVVL
jgi:murein DD-endopeptidase MepM/ murein hydrolase activator NlpD